MFMKVVTAGLKYLLGKTQHSGLICEFCLFCVYINLNFMFDWLVTQKEQTNDKKQKVITTDRPNQPRSKPEKHLEY